MIDVDKIEMEVNGADQRRCLEIAIEHLKRVVDTCDELEIAKAVFENPEDNEFVSCAIKMAKDIHRETLNKDNLYYVKLFCVQTAISSTQTDKAKIREGLRNARASAILVVRKSASIIA